LEKDDFFKNGLPRDNGIFDIAIKDDSNHGKAVLNSLFIINKYFNKNEIIKSNIFKWFNPVYGKYLLKTLFLLPWKINSGFFTAHLPNSYLKDTYVELWHKEENVLHETSLSKFRTETDVTQYLFKFWQLASNNF